MPVLGPLEIDLSAETVSTALRLDRLGDGPARAAALLGETLPLLDPRAYVRPAFIDRLGESDVTIEGRVFSSRILRVQLKEARKVFPYVITVGPALERSAAVSGDLLHRFEMETVADLALRSAAGRLEAWIRAESGFESISSLSPGSLPDWPLEEQTPLFALLGDVEERLGVRLTESLLMVPRKSVSGIFFPAEGTFESCRLCPRERCPGRRAPFDPAAGKRYEPLSGGSAS